MEVKNINYTPEPATLAVISKKFTVNTIQAK
jgi:hypothetical protein